MRVDILTIFPDFFTGPHDHGILSRARAQGLVEIAAHDLRAFTHDRHRTVDDRPFGGGEGMLLKCRPIFEALEALAVTPKPTRDLTRESVILLSPQGRPFTQAVAHQLATLDRIVFLCGRYEGVDERVNTLLCDRELSIGDFVLSGGELAAAVIVDAVVRLLPGVLGNPDSSRHESFGAADVPSPVDTADGVPRSTHGAGGLLDYPQYTRPADFRGALVPEVLTEGNHVRIRAWRRRAALEKTLRNRPDLLARAELTPADRKTLEDLAQPNTPQNTRTTQTSTLPEQSGVPTLAPHPVGSLHVATWALRPLPRRTPPMTTRALLQILLLSAIWGSSFLLIRIAGESFPPLWIALMRSALGALLLWTILALTGRKVPPRHRLPWLLLVALFNNAIPFTCFAWGEQVVPSNTASVLNATTPIWTLLLTMAVHRARAGFAVIGGVLLGFTGVLLVVFTQSTATSQGVTHAHFLRGVLLIALGTLGYAVATVIAKARLQGLDPLGIAAAQLALAAVMVAPLAFALGRPSHPRPANVLAIAVLGFIGSGVAYLLYFHLLTTISATHVVAVTYLLPLWGVFWGAIAHEPIGPGTLLGIVIALAGLAWMNLRPQRPPPTAVDTHASFVSETKRLDNTALGGPTSVRHTDGAASRKSTPNSNALKTLT